jgi:hypothetical protein
MPRFVLPLFKNISKSTWIGLKGDHCAVSMSPAVENTLSHGPEERSGYLQLSACHHNNGFNSRDAGSSLLTHPHFHYLQ